jgi:hypothetical protein
VRVIILIVDLVYMLSILVGAPVIWYLVPFFLLRKFICYEIQLIDELVVGSFEPPDARAACDRICRHFAYESYLLKVW